MVPFLNGGESWWILAKTDWIAADPTYSAALQSSSNRDAEAPSVGVSKVATIDCAVCHLPLFVQSLLCYEPICVFPPSLVVLDIEFTSTHSLLPRCTAAN